MPLWTCLTRHKLPYSSPSKYRSGSVENLIFQSTQERKNKSVLFGSSHLCHRLFCHHPVKVNKKRNIFPVVQLWRAYHQHRAVVQLLRRQSVLCTCFLYQFLDLKRRTAPNSDLMIIWHWTRAIEMSVSGQGLSPIDSFYILCSIDFALNTRMMSKIFIWSFI